MKNLARSAAICGAGGLLAILLGGGAAFAAPNPAGTGQPGVECGEDNAQTRPGHSANAPGSPFNENGVAGTRYAGEQPQNSKNPHSVSQYDVACFQVSQHD
jgi:hypothetical protein